MKKLGGIIKFGFREKLHRSWLLTAAGIGFLAGVGLSVWPSAVIFADAFWLVVATAILLFAITSRLKIMIVFAIVAGLILGLWRGTLSRVDLDIYREWIGQNVILRGNIKEDPDFGAGGETRLKIVNAEVILASDYDQLNSENVASLDDYFVSAPGTIWVSVFSQNADIKRSDAVEISGKLKSGFGTFPATISYGDLVSAVRENGVDPARDIRDFFGEKLRQVIPAPAADLGMGILAGQKTALPATLNNAFLAASLMHIVVASGYNLTILVRFARRLFAKISRFAALGFGGLLVFAFACVTGFSPSMTRASLVAGLSLAAWYYGRKFHPIVLLVLVATITVALDPAQIMAAPIIALFMGQFSPYGIVANILVLPILPFAMLATFAAGVGALILPPFLAQIVATPATWLLNYIILIAEKVANLPGAAQAVAFSWPVYVAIFAVIFAAIIYLKKVTKHNFREDSLTN